MAKPSFRPKSTFSSERDVIFFNFFGKDQNVTKKVYLDVMKTVLKPWFVQVAAGNLWFYQQDGATANTSNLIQTWWDENSDMFRSNLAPE